jgi:SAM-dependent methyltransferase
MLDFAAARSREQRSIVWQQADALALPFKDDEFDALVCQFGVMFFPDKTLAFREAARVLKPGARFVFNVWDRIEHNEFAHVVAMAVAAVFPENPPMFLARTAHSYYDIAVIRDELRSAGFSQIEIETVRRTGHAPSRRDPAIGFCQGSPLRNEIEARDASRLDEITETVAGAVRKRFGEGPISGKIQAHVITAIR